MGGCYSSGSKLQNGYNTSFEPGMPNPAGEKSDRPHGRRSGLPRPLFTRGDVKATWGSQDQLTTTANKNYGATDKQTGKLSAKCASVESLSSGSSTSVIHNTNNVGAKKTRQDGCAVARMLGDNIPMIDDDPDVTNANVKRRSFGFIPRRTSGKGPTPKKDANDTSNINKCQKRQSFPGNDRGKFSTRDKNNSKGKDDTGADKGESSPKSDSNAKPSKKSFRPSWLGGSSKRKKFGKPGVEKESKLKAGSRAPLASVDSLSLSSSVRTPCTSVLPSPAEETLPQMTSSPINTATNSLKRDETGAAVEICDNLNSVFTDQICEPVDACGNLNDTFVIGRDEVDTVDSNTSGNSSTKENTKSSLPKTPPDNKNVNGTFTVTDSVDSAVKEVNDNVFTPGESSVFRPDANSTSDNPIDLTKCEMPTSAVRQLVKQSRFDSERTASVQSLQSDDLMLDIDIDLDEPESEISTQDGQHRDRRTSSSSGVARRPSFLEKQEQSSEENAASKPHARREKLVRRYTDGGLPRYGTVKTAQGQQPLEELSTLMDNPGVVFRDKGMTTERPMSYPGPARPRKFSQPLLSNVHQFNLRPPRHSSIADNEVIEVDGVSYRQVMQELTSLKTMLFKLKRTVQEEECLSPFLPQGTKNGLNLGISQMSSLFFTSQEKPEGTPEQLALENQQLQTQVKQLQAVVEEQQKTIHLLQEQMTKYQCTKQTPDGSSDAAVQTDLMLLTIETDEPVKVESAKAKEKQGKPVQRQSLEILRFRHSRAATVSSAAEISFSLPPPKPARKGSAGRKSVSKENEQKEVRENPWTDRQNGSSGKTADASPSHRTPEKKTTRQDRPTARKSFNSSSKTELPVHNNNTSNKNVEVNHRSETHNGTNPNKETRTQEGKNNKRWSSGLPVRSGHNKGRPSGLPRPASVRK